MADTEVIADTTEKMSTDDISNEDDAPKEPETTAMDVEPSKTVKEELVKEETEELKPDSVVQETVDENGDVFEETTQVTRKVVKRTMKITETSSSTKTTTMTTPAKLYGKDLSEYDEVDVDALLAQLSPEEINILAKEVDPDDNFLPPNQRCSYECTKDPTGPLNRKKLIEHINKEALETPDLPELEPYVKGTVRGKKWVPPPRDEREIQADEQIAIDLGDEYEHALSDATQEEIIDLAAILGFHSMMNQDQYHASLLNKGQPVGMGWDGITKSTTQKLYPMDPPNNTDVEESIKRVKEDDPKLIELNLNNIKNISEEKFEQLFDALPQNEHLEVLSLTNVGLTDKTALLLAEAIEKSKTLRVLNVETNFINPPVIVTLVKTLLKARTIEEFRASNQRSTVLGNKIEMEITDLVEKNTSLLRLGLHLEFNDARHRVAAHLQRNIDRNEHELRKGTSSSSISKAYNAAGAAGDLSSAPSLQRSIKAKSPKPMHNVLTPHGRIDSKADLIASLASQKLSGQVAGEDASVVVPPVKRDAASPMRERKSPAKEKKFPVLDRGAPSKPAKPKVEEKLLEKLAEAIPLEKPVEARPMEEVTEGPKRNPKIGELRYSNLSKAVDDESVESDKRAAIDLKKSPAKEVVQPVAEIAQPIEVAPAEPVVPIKEPSPVKPPVVEEPPVEPLPSPAEIKKPDEPQPPPEPKEQKVEEVPKVEPIQEVKATAAIPEPLNIDDLTTNRARLSESVSPGRQLEDRLNLLKAKIDSFAEVADEKLSSLRTRCSDIDMDASKKEELPIPPQMPDLASTSNVDDKGPGLSSVRPKTASTKSTPYIPLISTPNSIGISFVYLRQWLPRPHIEVNSVFVQTPIVPQPVSLSQMLLTPIPEVTEISDISEAEQSVEASTSAEAEETKAENLGPEVAASMAEASKPELGVPKMEAEALKPEALPAEVPKVEAPSSAVPDIEAPKAESPKPEPPKTEAPKAESPTAEHPKIEAPKAESPKPEPPKTEAPKAVSPKPEPPMIEAPSGAVAKLTPDIIETPANLLTPKLSRLLSETTTLAQLSVQTGEALQIEPIKRVDAGTQSSPPPSPLLRLSRKKADSQSVDPVKTTETGTQSLPKPNPLLRLSVKKSDQTDLEPVAKSDSATQSIVEPKAEAASQTIEDEPIETLDDTTQTPLVFSSLEHDYIFPGLRRVPHLPRPKTISIGGGDRVIVRPSSKPINEVLMLLYPVFQDYSRSQDPPAVSESATKTFGLEQDIIKKNEPPNTINDLEDVLNKATQVSEVILSAPPPPEEPQEVEQPKTQPEVITSVKTEIVIPLVDEPQPEPDNSLQAINDATHFETKYTAVQEVSELRRTTIASEARVKVVDKAYKTVSALSSDEAHISKTSIRSANMWESLSSNLIKASEQTLFDISKATGSGEATSATRTKIGKVSVYSSIEDLTRSTRSDHIGGYIKTIEKTSVYSSTESLPYTKYSDRYKDDLSRAIYPRAEDYAPQSRSKHADRYTSDLVKTSGKVSVYSSTEDLCEVPYISYSERYSDNKSVGQYTFRSTEDLTLLPRSKFSDRYKGDQRSYATLPLTKDSERAAAKYDRSHYKSTAFEDHLAPRTQFKSSDDLPHTSGHSTAKSDLTAVLSSISRNQSALRPYTYVPSTLHADISIDHVRPRSPVGATHTSTLQLNVSPSGISELPSTRSSRYSVKGLIDKPTILISRSRDDKRSFRAVSPKEWARPSTSNLLSPYHHKTSEQANDDSADESSKATLDISSASAAEYNASTTSTASTATETTTKKRANIMDTIKMLKNRVREVITTEDRFSETHRPSHQAPL